MKMMLLATLLVLLPQDVDGINRTHAPAYRLAVRQYESAALVAESDPKRALDIVDQIFMNSEVNTKDRLVSLESPLGKYGKATEFYPHQARARAKLALARLELPNGDPKKAQALIQEAMGDLRKSVDSGVAKSKPILDAADQALKKLRAVQKPPAPGTPSLPAVPAAETAAEKNLLDSWAQLIENRKYKSARDLVEQKGGFLPASKKSEYVARTEEACRKHVAESVDEFVKALELTPRPHALRSQFAQDFNRNFALPSDAEVVGSYPALDWSRKERTALEKVRAADLRRPDQMLPVLDLLLPQIVASEPLEKTGVNRWFRASSQFTFHLMEELINAWVAQAKEETPERRRSLREEAQKLQARWSENQLRLPREFLARYPLQDRSRAFALLLEGFPVDLEELDRITIEACFTEDAPDAALERVIADLGKIRDQQGSRLSKPSQRKLFTELVAAQAALGFLEGKSVEMVTKEVQELGKPLPPLGGPSEPERWGPKIERVLLSLK
jgi:hypothetical protein